jgi:hypothetical protein
VSNHKEAALDNCYKTFNKGNIHLYFEEQTLFATQVLMAIALEIVNGPRNTSYKHKIVLIKDIWT